MATITHDMPPGLHEKIRAWIEEPPPPAWFEIRAVATGLHSAAAEEFLDCSRAASS